MIAVSANSCWNIVNFRAGLIKALVAAGHEVVVIAPPDRHSARLLSLGAAFEPIRLNSSGLSPVEDAVAMLAYRRLLRRLRPAAFLGFTAKPNIHGTLAARSLGIPAISNISGLGTAFMRRGPLQKLVSTLYRIALRGSSTVFFQNPDDLALFVDRGLVDPARARRLPGSGVDLDAFRPSTEPRRPGPFRFLLVARMLWDKGIGEYVEAARMLAAGGVDAEFQLLGPAGVDNRTAIPPEQLGAWVEDGVVTWLGPSDDVRRHLAEADCVVLPSYREGVPRSLIEAAAMGRPIITTDEVGCREAVDDGVTGYLCETRSATSLRDAMQRMLSLSREEREAMGARGRDKAEREFDQQLVIDAYRAALDRSAAATRSGRDSS